MSTPKEQVSLESNSVPHLQQPLLIRRKMKQIKFSQESWDEIKALAEELAEERGHHRVSLQNAVAEAVKFYKLHRKNAEESNGK